MKKPGRHLCAALLMGAAVTMTVCPVQAQTVEHHGVTTHGSPSPGLMAFDLVLVRPLSLAATAVGFGLFVVDIPLAIFQKHPAQPFYTLVAEPWDYTFTRPLGAISQTGQ